MRKWRVVKCKDCQTDPLALELNTLCYNRKLCQTRVETQNRFRVHDRELDFTRLSDTFRDFLRLLRLFETFKSQKVHEFNEVLYGKDEVLHTLHTKDEILGIIR